MFDEIKRGIVRRDKRKIVWWDQRGQLNGIKGELFDEKKGQNFDEINV